MAGNNLKRDEVEAWRGTDIWGHIEQAVHDEVNRIRVAAKVFVPCPIPNAINVLTDAVAVNLDPLTLGQNSLPFLEISRSFGLNDEQLVDEEKFGTAVTLARMAATAVAMAEEIFLFGGQDPLVTLPTGIKFQREDSVRGGLLGEAAQTLKVKPPDPTHPGIFGEENFNAVEVGINMLLDKGQPGPYVLFLSPPRFADAHRSEVPTLVIPADRIRPLVPGPPSLPGQPPVGGFHATVGLPANRGLLVSLGGEPTSLVISQDTTIGYTQQQVDPSLYLFRVFERIQFVVRDPLALLLLDFVGVEPARGKNVKQSGR